MCRDVEGGLEEGAAMTRGRGAEMDEPRCGYEQTEVRTGIHPAGHNWTGSRRASMVDGSWAGGRSVCHRDTETCARRCLGEAPDVKRRVADVLPEDDLAAGSLLVGPVHIAAATAVTKSSWGRRAYLMIAGPRL